MEKKGKVFTSLSRKFASNSMRQNRIRKVATVLLTSQLISKSMSGSGFLSNRALLILIYFGFIKGRRQSIENSTVLNLENEIEGANEINGNEVEKLANDHDGNDDDDHNGEEIKDKNDHVIENESEYDDDISYLNNVCSNSLNDQLHYNEREKNLELKELELEELKLKNLKREVEMQEEFIESKKQLIKTMESRNEVFKKYVEEMNSQYLL